MTIVPFQSEHQALTRLEGPVGREITLVQSEVESLAYAFANSGAIDVNALAFLRESLDRLDMSSKLLALADDLAQQAGVMRRMVDELANHRAPGALDRSNRHLGFRLDEIQDLIDSERPIDDERPVDA
jgi:hypothetical protein